MINIVELAADQDDCAFDQPCKFGHRVEGHAVYCQNDAWVDGPRKCRRSWYTGGSVRDEDCPGFQPNPEFKGQIGAPAALAEPLCSFCGGVKVVPYDTAKKTIETCDHCQGVGTEPQDIGLSDCEIDVLESCLGEVSPSAFDRYEAILSGEPFRLRTFPERLITEGLLDMRSVAWDGPATVHTVRLTRKGYALLQLAWNQREAND